METTLMLWLRNLWREDSKSHSKSICFKIVSVLVWLTLKQTWIDSISKEDILISVPMEFYGVKGKNLADMEDALEETLSKWMAMPGKIKLLFWSMGSKSANGLLLTLTTGNANGFLLFILCVAVRSLCLRVSRMLILFLHIYVRGCSHGITIYSDKSVK